jgi:aerobic C4-dicarboxylate transport protein
VLGFGLEISEFKLWNVLTYLQDEILFVFAVTSTQTMIPEDGILERLAAKKGGGLSHADRLFSH